MPPTPAIAERPPMAAPVTASPARAFAAEAAPLLNKINMNVKGDQVHLEALLDRKGIAALKKKLANLEALLDDEDDEVADGMPDEEDIHPLG